jgi:putative ABC transport system permease protein
MGGVSGLLLAQIGVRALSGALPTGVPVAGALRTDGAVIAFTAAITVLTGLLFGVIPALRATRQGRDQALRSGGAAAIDRGRRHLQAILVVAEVALAVVLAVGAGLMVRSLLLLRAVDPGFRMTSVLALRVAPPEARYATAAQRRAVLDEVIERVGAVPGVTAVGAVHLMPLGGSNWNPPLHVSASTTDSVALEEVDWRVATPAYFQAMGIPLLRGRTFTGADRDDTPAVALVNATLARRVWPGEDVLGKRVRTAFEGKEGWATVVGVVGDTKDQELASPARPQIYRPHAQFPLPSMAVMVRAAVTPEALVSPVRNVIRAIDRDIAVADLQPLPDIVAHSMAEPRLLTVLLSAFGLLALALGGVGIYGVISYTVAQRTQEIGVRLALGAEPAAVLRMVVWGALRLAAAGVAVGIILALAVTRVLAHRLYGVTVTDATTFFGVVAVLGGVAVVASYVPARRASRVDPVRALRWG